MQSECRATAYIFGPAGDEVADAQALDKVELHVIQTGVLLKILRVFNHILPWSLRVPPWLLAR